jgi:hypothetical protein
LFFFFQEEHLILQIKTTKVLLAPRQAVHHHQFEQGASAITFNPSYKYSNKLIEKKNKEHSFLQYPLPYTSWDLGKVEACYLLLAWQWLNDSSLLQYC